MSVLCVIPARYASIRLPGKVLRILRGKPMLQWVWEAARSAKTVDRVIIATEDDRVVTTAERWGARTVLTSPDHPSGTDRVAEVARLFPADIVINLQGDEPLMRGAHIDEVARALLKNPSIPMATLATPCPPDEVQRPSVVKVVLDAKGNALYFSRLPIPYPRTGAPAYLKHLGIYGYRAAALRKFVRLPQAPLEKNESLEQLRALENGMPIAVRIVEGRFAAVDTPEDLRRVRRLLASRSRAPS